MNVVQFLLLLLCGIGMKCHRYMTPQVQTFKQLLLLGGKFCRASSSLLFFFNPAHQQLFVILAMCIAWERKKDNTVVGREA